MASQLKFNRTLVGLLLSLAAFCANANVTYNYVGNPFTNGDYVTASVTFSDPLINSAFSGIISSASSISSWSIEIAQLPGTKLDNTNSVSTPYWFDFNNGNIIGWQLLGSKDYSGTGEIYTTRNTPYGSILGTADYSAVYGSTSGNPGSWSLTPVPIPGAIWLFGSVVAGFVGINRRKQMQR